MSHKRNLLSTWRCRILGLAAIVIPVLITSHSGVDGATFKELGESAQSPRSIALNTIGDRSGRHATSEPVAIVADTTANSRETVGGDDNPWKDGDVLPPEDLAKWLSADEKPRIFQVGFFPLYRLSHITGSVYAGPANDSAGLEKLKKAADALPRTKDVVLYCGCCPFSNCPNVKPAFAALQAMGFTKLKVLMLPNNFTQDWMNKGYPTERAEREAPAKGEAR